MTSHYSANAAAFSEQLPRCILLPEGSRIDYAQMAKLGVQIATGTQM